MPDRSAFTDALRRAEMTMQQFAEQEAGVSARFVHLWFTGERDSERVEHAVRRFYLRHVDDVIERHDRTKRSLQHTT